MKYRPGKLKTVEVKYLLKTNKYDFYSMKKKVTTMTKSVSG